MTKKKSKVLISFKCFKITLRDTNVCVGTYLGSLVLSQTLSYSYQNIFFTRQNWLFTLAIKLILKKQEKNMPLNWHFFNFIFIGCFFFRIICVSCLHEICNTFQSIQVEKKITQKLSKFKFLIIVFFGQNEFFYLWKQCAPV